MVKTSGSRCACSRCVTASCTENSAFRTHVLASSQSHLLSLGRKMGLLGPGLRLSCRRSRCRERWAWGARRPLCQTPPSPCAAPSQTLTWMARGSSGPPPGCWYNRVIGAAEN